MKPSGTQLHPSIRPLRGQEKFTEQMLQPMDIQFNYESQEHQLLSDGETRTKIGEMTLEKEITANIEPFTKESGNPKDNRIHTGEKPHMCVQHDRSFSQLCDFISHKKIHFWEGNVNANDCGKTFSVYANFIQYQRQKTPSDSNQ
ncbi:Zinc finger protein 271 [Galemys pyrenaicus]|uniref:Zinc finger protein 271 n=1 Tax=Galemys pyrenaicus TaxID=202257 RepID=A0A8J6AHV7_GALPY|nr:Zinc finger protein 271 [Galemys pyrenaicus]